MVVVPLQAHAAWLEGGHVPLHRPLGSCHPLLAATGVQEREFERMAGLLSCQDLSTQPHAFCVSAYKIAYWEAHKRHKLVQLNGCMTSYKQPLQHKRSELSHKSEGWTGALL